MHEKKGFLKVYLILMVIFAILQFTDSILGLFNIENPFVIILSVLVLLFFIFNVIAWPLMYRYGAEKHVYLLPILYISSYLFLFVSSLVLIIAQVKVAYAWVILTALSVVFAMGLLGYALYLFKIVDFSEED
jgi:hypothetical protein